MQLSTYTPYERVSSLNDSVTTTQRINYIFYDWKICLNYVNIILMHAWCNLFLTLSKYLIMAFILTGFSLDICTEILEHYFIAE